MYEASRVRTGGVVAIKVISKKDIPGQDKEEKEIFSKLMRQELKIVRQLDHPHIVKVLDVLEDDENIYIA